MVIDVKAEQGRGARWFQLRCWPTGIDILLHYTNMGGCYIIEHIGTQRTIGM